MGNESSSLTNTLDSNDVVAVSRLIQHFQNPQNLLSYMIFSAWVKFMGVAAYIPTITIG